MIMQYRQQTYIMCTAFYLFIYFLVQVAQFPFHIQNSDYCLIIYGYTQYVIIILSVCPLKIGCFDIGLPIRIIITYRLQYSSQNMGRQMTRVTIETKYILRRFRARLFDTIEVQSLALYLHWRGIRMCTIILLYTYIQWLLIKSVPTADHQYLFVFQLSQVPSKPANDRFSKRCSLQTYYRMVAA